MHPEAEPTQRNRRKRALLTTLMGCPPLIVTFDAGHRGVKGVPSQLLTNPGFQVSLSFGVAFGPEAFSLNCNFESLGKWDIEVPYAAVYRITCVPLEETHIYSLDAEIAQARHRLYTSPTRTLVH